MSSPASVISLGCRMNLAEGETIRAMLAGRDLAVVNSCAVTAAAVKQGRAALRQARRRHPHAELVVTGCAAAELAPLADRVVPGIAKLVPASWGGTGAVPLPVARDRARAFVGVQDGCDHDCTFCVTTIARGASRSVAPSLIVEQIAELVEQGRREVVLSGIDLSGYGRDRGDGATLVSLVEAILTDTRLERLRLSSLDASEVDDGLLALLGGEARVMPHLHLSLQSGDDLILKRMKRRHTRTQAVTLVARLKARRDVAIGADLIAGFPTESAAAHAATRALLDDCDVVHSHIFPYSPRPGTAAARMPQVAPDLRRARAAELRHLAAARHARWLSSLTGSTQRVLVERPGDRGYTEQFAELRLSQEQGVGTIATARVTGTGTDHLTGTTA